MVRFIILLASTVFLSNVYAQGQDDCENHLLNFTKEPLTSDTPVNLCSLYRGKVTLVVNTASFCGFTPQYKELESLYERYRDKGLVVLGFPSNDFGQQEPGNENDIKAFCERTYGVKFPMFEKTAVKKGTNDPLYAKLGSESGEYPEWNFHKYLLDRNGRLIASIPSRTSVLQSDVLRKIESLL